MMWFISLPFFILFLSIPILTYIRTYLESKMIKQIVSEKQKAEGKRIEALKETIEYSDLFSSYGASNWAFERYNIIRKDVISLSQRQVMIQSVFGGIQSLLNILMQSFLAFFSMGVSWGGIGAAFVSLQAMQDNVAKFRGAITRLPKTLIPIDRLGELLKESSILNEHNTENSLIELTDIEVVVDEKKILEINELKIQAGEKLAIVGKNGSGKTTLLHVLMQQIKIDSGIQKIALYKDESERRKNIGYAPVNANLFSDTVFNNIGMGQENKDTICNILTKLRLDNKNNDMPDTLSKGGAQRVNLARTLISDRNKIWFFDEPTISLDKDIAVDIMKLIFESDKTVVFVTHDLDMAKPATRIIMLENGQIVKIGKYDDLISDDYLTSR